VSTAYKGQEQESTMCFTYFNSFAIGNVRGFRAKIKNRSHVALRERNSGAESSREWLKRRGKSSSLHFKEIFWLGVVDFL